MGAQHNDQELGRGVNSLTGLLAHVVGQPPESSTILQLRRVLLQTPGRRRFRDLQEIGNAVLSSGDSAAEGERVLLAKVLVALLPTSLGVIRAILAAPPKELGEVQFSLFCFLDQANDLRLPPREREDVLQLIREYLLRVPSDAAQAAWMAGDLLGEHWPLEQSLPVLEDVMKSARFKAGREAALHGLSHALGRAKKREQWSIVKVLNEVKARDRSKEVRDYAESILGNLRGL